MKIKSRIISPHVYLLTYPTQYELCMSFVRIQEFYESDSPKFRGKYFTLEDYIDYWSLEHGKGSFTYPAVWNGFNIPGKIINKWFSKFQDERPREMAIFKEIGKLTNKEFGVTETLSEYMDILDCIYIIGVNEEGCKDEMEHAIEHETAHAFYHLYPDYKKSCYRLIKNLPSDRYMADRDLLIKMGYCKAVINDELQAYYSVIDDTLGLMPKFAANFEEFKINLKNNSK